MSSSREAINARVQVLLKAGNSAHLLATLERFGFKSVADVPGDQEAEFLAALKGPEAPRGAAAIVCPHCDSQGTVTAKAVRQKRGISGAKATGAVLTGGLTVLGTGLSRKQNTTELHCRSCNMTWTVDR